MNEKAKITRLAAILWLRIRCFLARIHEVDALHVLSHTPTRRPFVPHVHYASFFRVESAPVEASINAEDEKGVWLTAERDQVLGAFRDADLSRRPF